MTLTQLYRLYLCDGNTFEVVEPWGLPAHRSLLGQFERAEDSGMLKAYEKDGSMLCIPKRNILYIRAAAIENTRRNAI